jgi:serine/threonine-protein kinase
MGADDELQERAKARVGTTLRGKYHLDAVLGVGGMAFVYRASDPNGDEYAIKMLHPELSVQKSIRERFLREGRAASAVKHSGVVAILDEDVADDGAAFLAMELLHGASLDALADRSGGRLPVPQACTVLDQLLDVLVAAHAGGVIHRDLKPSNLFLTDTGVLKVLDFGIARVRDGLTSGVTATTTGVLLGTPAFMAPEQARAKSSQIDARTDLWAAAATFFTLASGKMVHEGDNPAQLMIAAATSFPRSVRSVAPDVPEEIARVVDRALSFDRGARWDGAAEMRDALRAACMKSFGATPSLPHVSGASSQVELASAPTLPAGTTVPPAVSTGARERRRGLPVQILAGGVIVTAVVALAIVKYSSRGHEEPSAIADSVMMHASSTVPVVVASSSVPVVASVERPPPVPVTTTTPPPPSTTHARQVPRGSSCDPPYHFNANGTKVFHKECL